MNFIKKIFDNDADEEAHLQFQKFSKGEFRDRAVIKVKQSKGKYTISTTSEFSNELVRSVAKKLGSDKAQVTGAIISTSDLTGEIDFQGKKQFQGVKQYLIDQEMEGNRITELIKKFPKVFFALSFKTNNEDTILKIKAKAPKSGKPGSKGGERPKPDFCKIITNDSEIGKSFVFEKPSFKTAEITHHFMIEELVRPELSEGDKNNFAKIREMSKRKGKIIREAEIDGEKITKEKEFEA